MNDQPKRRSNRKRQLAGVLFVMVFISYPLSFGPCEYAIGRGWGPVWLRRAGWWYFQPAFYTLSYIPAGDGRSLGSYWLEWGLEWFDRGERDRLAR